MNKYRVEIPYSCVEYGTIYADVYAEDEEEAEDLARDYANRYNEESEPSDPLGKTRRRSRIICARANATIWKAEHGQSRSRHGTPFLPHADRASVFFCITT